MLSQCGPQPALHGALMLGWLFRAALSCCEGATPLFSLCEQPLNSGSPGKGFSSAETIAWKWQTAWGLSAEGKRALCSWRGTCVVPVTTSTTLIFCFWLCIYGKCSVNFPAGRMYWFLCWPSEMTLELGHPSSKYDTARVRASWAPLTDRATGP